MLYVFHEYLQAAFSHVESDFMLWLFKANADLGTLG